MPHARSLSAIWDASQGATTRDVDRARLADALPRMGIGDRDAFGLVYSLTFSKLFGICIRICGDKSAAEDVVGDAYLLIWKHASDWDPGRGSPMAWLCRIARNRAIDWQRSRAVRGSEVFDDAFDVVDDAPDAESLLLTAENHSQVHTCLGALTSEQQSAIGAAFFDGHTYAEVAARSGMPIATMKSRVRRGLRQMRQELERADRVAIAARQRIMVFGTDAGMKES